MKTSTRRPRQSYPVPVYPTTSLSLLHRRSHLGAKPFSPHDAVAVGRAQSGRWSAQHTTSSMRASASSSGCKEGAPPTQASWQGHRARTARGGHALADSAQGRADRRGRKANCAACCIKQTIGLLALTLTLIRVVQSSQSDTRRPRITLINMSRHLRVKLQTTSTQKHANVQNQMYNRKAS